MALEATVGVETSLNLWEHSAHSADYSPEPPHEGSVPGMTLSDEGILSGTPTRAGRYTVTLWGKNSHNTENDQTVAVEVVEAAEPAPTLTVGQPGEVDLQALVDSEVSSASPIPDGMTFSAPGLLSGTPTTVGTTEVVCKFSDPFGNPVDVGVVVVTVVGSEPDPEPDPEPEPDPDEPDELDPWELHERLARALGARVAAFVGQPGNPDVVATAEAQVPIVTEYVRGFTRGRGFRDESPAGPLRAVIVSGVARLATNPEQVAHFQTGDYSERPAQLAGWTLAELGVLHRYRRTTA